jgi:beta propeller repeat protein
MRFLSAASCIILTLFLFTSFFIGMVSAGTETLITVNTSDSVQQSPAIWGDWIVWEDSRDSVTGRDIYGYNIVTGEERRISHSGYARNPAISNDVIVWQDSRPAGGAYNIYLYNLTTGAEETRLFPDSLSQTSPAIDAAKIVWQVQQSNGKYDIMMLEYPLMTMPVSLTPGTSASDQKNPEISGDLVVWEDKRNGGTGTDIFLNDTSPSSYTTYNLTPGILSSSKTHPSISGRKVVWRDGSLTINMTDTGIPEPWAIEQVNTPGGSVLSLSPSIMNNNVVWAARRSGSTNYDLYIRDVSPPQPQVRITQDSASVVINTDTTTGKTMGPDISGNRIVWTDKRSSSTKYDVYLYTDDITTTCPEADFSVSAQSGTAPLTVTFTDTSSGKDTITHRKWEFGDGSSAASLSPAFTYSSAGIYAVRLTVGNAACRNETPIANKYNISVGIPFASFTANTTSGIAPLDVAFTDTSSGATQWNWTFGDGSAHILTTDILQKDVTHRYSTPGTYIATLNASNSYGSAKATKTIEVQNGAKMDSNPTITGIDISSVSGRQLLTFDPGQLPNRHNTGTALICPDSQLEGKGFQNITFLSDDGIGFKDDGGQIKGNISSVILQSKAITPLGFSKSVGEQSSVRLSLTSPEYPVGGSINTQMSEGATTADRLKFDLIAAGSNFNSIAGLAYTTKITKTGFAAGTTARLNMSVNATWVNQLGTDHLYLIRITDDGNTGEVLQTRLVATDAAANLYYVETDSPHGASTFGLALLSGSGNPLQLITLTIASQVNPPPASSSSDYTGSPYSEGKGLSAPAPQNVPEQKAPPVFIDPGKTAALYTNPSGVITQETNLKSTDNLASVVLGEGTIAQDSTGSPLSSISIASLAEGSIPDSPAGQAVMIADRAYELGPDGATFSPGITVTFTIPQAQWGKEYSLMMYDREAGTWTAIPGSFDAKDGTFTAVISHFCCIALFEKEIGKPAGYQASRTPQPANTRLAPAVVSTPQPPQTALSIFYSMAGWVTGEAAQQSSYLTAISIICIIVLSLMVLYRRRNNP